MKAIHVYVNGEKVGELTSQLHTDGFYKVDKKFIASFEKHRNKMIDRAWFIHRSRGKK